MSRRCAAVALGFLTIASTVLAVPLVAGAQSAPSAAAGWWSRSPAQSAPQEGFAIASAPDGPVSVAALVVDVGGRIVAGSFSAVEVGGLGQQDAAIVVCPAAGPVVLPGEGGGDLADAPEPDCERGSVPFERDDASMQWSADLSALVAELGEEISLVILPAPSDGPVQETFEVRLAAPEVELRTVAADPAPDGGGPSPSPAPVPSGPVDPSPSRAPASFDRDLTAGPPSTSGVPSGLAPLDPDAEPAAPEPVPGVESADEAEEVAASPVRPVAGISAGRGPQVGKAVGYVVLSALAGLVVTLGGRFAGRRQLRR